MASRRSKHHNTKGGSKRQGRKDQAAAFPPDWEKQVEEYKTMEGMENATRDELLAHVFLAGCFVKGKLSFLRGENENKVREAWIRVLTGERPLPYFLRHDLVVLFEKNVRLKAMIWNLWDLRRERAKGHGPTVSLTPEHRRLVFKHRSRNTRNAAQKDFDIANFIKNEIQKAPLSRKRRTNAVTDAMKFFGLKSRQAIYHALKRSGISK